MLIIFTLALCCLCKAEKFGVVNSCFSSFFPLCSSPTIKCSSLHALLYLAFPQQLLPQEGLALCGLHPGRPPQPAARRIWPPSRVLAEGLGYPPPVKGRTHRLLHLRPHQHLSDPIQPLIFRRFGGRRQGRSMLSSRE